MKTVLYLNVSQDNIYLPNLRFSKLQTYDSQVTSHHLTGEAFFCSIFLKLLFKFYQVIKPRYHLHLNKNGKMKRVIIFVPKYMEIQRYPISLKQSLTMHKSKSDVYLNLREMVTYDNCRKPAIIKC